MKKPPRRSQPATDKAPYVVHPREVAKSFKGYDTDPEILLACMIVSGTNDTAEICRTEVYLANDLAPATGLEAERYEAFRRVWKHPSDEEKSRVLDLACEIAGTLGSSTQRVFAWKGQLY